MRDQDGNFEIGELADNGFDVHEEGGAADALEEESRFFHFACLCRGWEG